MLCNIKSVYARKGKEFYMDDSLRNMFDRRFRREKMDEKGESPNKEVTQLDGPPGPSSPGKSDDSGVGSDDDYPKESEPILKEMIRMTKTPVQA